MKAQSKNRDPFSRIPIPKSFYHPSQQKNLTKTQKKIALSPSKERRVNPEDEAFLKGSNIYSSQTPPTREHDFGPSKFDESWPSSERPSIASTSGYDRSDNITMVSDVKQSLFTHLDPVEEKAKTSSILQRYINRFRNSAPMSREERVQMGVGDDKDFWWLGKTSDSNMTPTSSSTPKDEDRKRSRQFIDRSESQAYTDTFQSLSSSRKRRSQLEDDLRTQNLQEKADRILSQSESSLGSLEAGPAVSSDGLASSESQSSSFDEPTITPRPQYRTDFKDKRDKDMPVRNKAQNEDILSYRSNIKRPEDDILYQWRLQRKMDLSRNGAAELISKNNSEVQSKLKEIQQRVLLKDISETESRPQLSTPRFTSAPTRNDDIYTHSEVSSHSSVQEPEKIPITSSQKPYIASPTLAHKQRGDKENVEPHLHLMCDVLPCPHAQKYQEQFKNLYDSEVLPNGEAEYKSVSTTQRKKASSNVVTDSRKTDLLENRQYIEAEKQAEKRQKDSRNHCDSANRKSTRAQTQDKSSSDSLNRVTSPEIEADYKQSPTVVKSTKSVLESVDFESSDMDVTYRDKEEDISHTKDPGSSNRIPKSPTKSKVIHPKYSSSPARSTPPITSAIGQTVKDYMFTASTSVDSMSSLLSNIADSSPERQQTSSSSRQQGQSSRRELSEQSHSSNRHVQHLGGEQILEQTDNLSRGQTQSSNRQQSEARDKSKKQQTSSSRLQKESSIRAKSPTSSQQNVQLSSQYSKHRGISGRTEKERDSTESLARSSQDQSTWTSRDLEGSGGEDQDGHTRYSSEINDDDDVSDEEFADDQLLKLLRQQRNDIEKKLGEIDKQLLER
ncbi:hypothetical protein LOTGIDRAFT_165089 [Lottia gigantea]|uniref:Uncharacterized protein n=1 Tax=Lottia gigantea TaxID=225164 RepID=V4A3H7_LOTGI|nr:hypothetical protein LOTGIDRAFT_165089 [Lottia gigantea]ESO89495.1 hypothetical protein LOTGIDRAFT_165089 [Lottia gigantea]